MSRAIPVAFLSAMSMTTTSASDLSATPRATVAPTFPAPPTTVTFRFIRCSSNKQTILLRVLSALRGKTSRHVFDDRVGKLRRLQFSGAVHQAREVVGDAPAGD